MFPIKIVCYVGGCHYIWSNTMRMHIDLGKGSKIKLIIFAEFRKGVPPPTPPSQKIINFFSKNFVLLYFMFQSILNIF